MSQLFDLSC